MRGASRDSLAAASERLDVLLGATGPAEGTAAGPVGVAQELFEVTDLLDGQPSLRSALADPARDGEAKARLAASLLAGKVSDQVVDLLSGMVRSRWSEPRDLADATSALGIQAALLAAERAGRLDAVEDEMFRFERVVDGQPDLRRALTDPALPAANKTALVHGLLDGKAAAETVHLVSRTVTHLRGASLEAALDALKDAAASRQQRLVATVTVAVPLTEDQRARLAAALAAQYGHQVHLNVVVDPSVVGGVRVALGDELIDGTIATRLDEARRRLTG